MVKIYRYRDSKGVMHFKDWGFAYTLCEVCVPAIKYPLNELTFVESPEVVTCMLCLAFHKK